MHCFIFIDNVFVNPCKVWHEVSLLSLNFHGVGFYFFYHPGVDEFFVCLFGLVFNSQVEDLFIKYTLA